MKGVQLTKMVQELELNNLTPEIDLSGIVIKTAEINRPALQLTGYLEHFANERVQIIGYVFQSFSGIYHTGWIIWRIDDHRLCLFVDLLLKFL